MHRHALVAGAMFAIAGLMLPNFPAAAITAKEKMATCKFGADDQKLQGKPRTAFIAKCMANKNDPRGAGQPGAAAGPKPEN
jgi:hypothetical protein